MATVNNQSMTWVWALGDLLGAVGSLTLSWQFFRAGADLQFAFCLVCSYIFAELLKCHVYRIFNTYPHRA